MTMAPILIVVSLLLFAPTDPPVAQAAMRGDIEKVRSLLKAGADVNAAQGDGMTALHWAARRHDVKMVRMLLYAGANPKALTRIGGYTPVHLASVGGHGTVLGVLLDAGADANTTTSSGATPLHLAASSGDAKAVEALLEYRADVNARETVAGQTPLMFAAYRGRVAAIKLLTKHGADVALRTKVLKSASRSRSRSGSSARRPRSSRGATPRGRERGSGRRPPGDPTAELQSREAEQERLEKEAAKAAATEKAATEKASDERASGKTPAPGEASARRSRSTRRRSSTPRAARQGGLTALLHACRQGHIVAAQALLDAGAGINQVSASDKTSPLMIATINGHFDLAMVLLQRGADPNLANAAGGAPLYAAINVHWAPHAFYPQPSTAQEQTTHLGLIEALLKAGADPDARLKTKLWYTGYNFDQSRESETGATPFWRAAQSSDADALRLLVAHGAKPEIWTKVTSSRRRSNGLTSGLRSGADADQKKKTGTKKLTLPPVPIGGPACSPLHMAAGAGFKGNFHRNAPAGWLPAVRYLVEELGFDVNVPDYKGYTPLHHAAFRGDNDMIRYLLAKGGDVMAIARSGQTTVDMANGPVQRLQPFPETIKLLESMGAKNNHRAVSR